MAPSFHHAKPPHIPALDVEPSRAEVQAEAERRAELHQAEQRERRSMVRGLLFLLAIVLVASMMRAGWDRVFPHGWWRP